MWSNRNGYFMGKENRVDPANLFKKGQAKFADTDGVELISKIKKGYCEILDVGTMCTHDCRDCSIATGYMVIRGDWEKKAGLS